MDNLIGKEVYVYYNLHKKTWSVKDWKTKLVIAHLDTITLKNCELKVSEKGRQRVIRTRRKNVHAGIRGIVWDIGKPDLESCEEVTYNPYKYDSFVYKLDDKVQLLKTKCIYMSNRQLWAV